MKLRMLISIFLCGAAAAIAVTVPHYVFSPAGNYPGAVETDPNGASLSQIAGFYLLAGGATYAYIQTGKTFITAQPAGSFSSYLFSINSAGLAVGGFCQQPVCGAPFASHGYSYDFASRAITTIDYPGAATTAAYGINDAGVIVGGFCDQGTNGCPLNLFNIASHGFIDDNGTFTQLDFPGSNGTTAFGVNKSGTVVGVYEIDGTATTIHAFVYENGQYTDINFPGGNWSEATGVNDLGVVVGHFQDASFNVNGFMYYKGQFAQINVQPGHTTAIWGINKRNDLVGTWLGARGQSDTFKAIPTR